MAGLQVARGERPAGDGGFDRRKFRTLVHYIIWASSGRLKVSASRINRILWLADGRAYADRGATITGAVYVREGGGPTAVETQAARTELQRQGLIEAMRDSALAGRREIFASRARPDPAEFSSEELGYVEMAIREVGDEVRMVGPERPSYDYAWELARKGEVIPPHAILALRTRDPTPRQIELARVAARELGLSR
jgi:hypothetical protein